MSNAFGGFPKVHKNADSKKGGLMSSQDKITLDKLTKQVSEILRILANIPTSKLKRSYTKISLGDITCGEVVIDGNVVTLNININSDSKDLFKLPEEYAPKTGLVFIIPILKSGKVLNGQLHILPDGSVTCTCSNYKGISINTSVSYVK